MSHGVEKDTYINADPKTTKSLTYDLLDHLYISIEEVRTQQNGRLTKLENRRKRDTGISVVSGFVGGFMAMTIYYIRKWIQ